MSKILGLIISVLVLSNSPAIWAQTTTYQYDDQGRLIEVRDTIIGEINYDYDDAGNLIDRMVTSGTPPNDPPVAVDDFVGLDEGDVEWFNLTANDTDPDGDPLTISSVSNSNSEISVSINGTNGVNIQANEGGFFTFTYDISDGNGGTDTGTVSVFVAQ